MPRRSPRSTPGLPPQAACSPHARKSPQLKPSQRSPPTPNRRPPRRPCSTCWANHCEALITTGLPTLSQIQAWDTEHLIDAAEHWYATADRWDGVYGQVWQQSLGMDWRGQARDALVDRTTIDKTTVMGHSDRLREA